MYSLSNHESLKSQGGFTLVELAVVMIIIGLLIGGVLKGQELISNAQVTATVAQVEGYDAAATTFRDIYDAVPGDITNPDVRLPGCAGNANCDSSGGPSDGNGRIDDAPNAAPGGEGNFFWVHLSAADLISGVNMNGGPVWGGIYPEAELGGVGFHVGYSAGGPLGANPGARAGHYLGVTQTAGAAPAAGMTPSEAFRIDSKLDDGIADTGSVFADDAVDPTCVALPDYNTAIQTDSCMIYIRFQQ